MFIIFLQPAMNLEAFINKQMLNIVYAEIRLFNHAHKLIKYYWQAHPRNLTWFTRKPTPRKEEILNLETIMASGSILTFLGGRLIMQINFGP